MDCNVLWNHFSSFFRLRAADRIPRQELAQSEARLRSQQISNADLGRPVPDARLRQKEGFSGGSLEANLSRSGQYRTHFLQLQYKGTIFTLCHSPPVPQQQHQRSPRFQQPTVPRREDIPSHEPNPFTSSSSTSNNPFGTDGDDDLGDNNPFASNTNTVTRSNNPFGEDEDYDEKLNPFGAN